MTVGRLLIPLIGLLIYSVAVSAVTPEELESLRCRTWNLIDNSGHDKPLLAQIVRLVFHDCVGGCNGLINFDDHGNAGLASPVATLQTVYEEEFAASMSRADFWAFAGTWAVIKGATQRPGESVPSVSFLEGRLDTTAHRHDLDLPNPYGARKTKVSMHGGIEQVIGFFDAAFGFDERESVAIMGAHTLGRAHPQNSGFRNTWVRQPDVLDNAFYVDLINRAWHQRTFTHADGSQNTQWVHDSNGGSRGLMLNPDMSLLKKINPDENGLVTCNFAGDNACPNADTYGIVEQFASDNSLWLSEFAAAWNKMLQAGSDALSPIAVDTSSLPQCPGATSHDSPSGPRPGGGVHGMGAPPHGGHSAGPGGPRPDGGGRGMSMEEEDMDEVDGSKPDRAERGGSRHDDSKDRQPAAAGEREGSKDANPEPGAASEEEERAAPSVEERVASRDADGSYGRGGGAEDGEEAGEGSRTRMTVVVAASAVGGVLLASVGVWVLQRMRRQGVSPAAQTVVEPFPGFSAPPIHPLKGIANHELSFQARPPRQGSFVAWAAESERKGGTGTSLETVIDIVSPKGMKVYPQP